MKRILWGVVLVVGCATVRPLPQLDTPITYVSIPESGVYAWTRCDSATNKILIEFDSVRVRYNPELLAEILIHEKRHVEQLSTFIGGCLAGLNAYQKNPVLRLRWEMQAECARLHSLNLEPPAYKLKLIAWTAHYFEKEWVIMTQPEMFKKFLETCEGERSRR